MALTDDNSMVMPVTPMYGNNNGGFGGWGGDGWWIILLFILLGNNGWGGYGGFGGGNELYPWMNQAELTNGGFQNQALSGQINGIQSGIQGLSTQICNSTSDVVQTLNSGFAGAEISANARQMANMQQMFGLSTQFADCCCENRLASADLKYTIATENCADRYEAANNTRDIIENANRNNQAIIDKLCALELDAKNDRIAELERQLTAANLAASQVAQTSTLLADNARQTVALEQYLNPTPIPAYMVQNPNCCTQNYGGCGCGSL